MHPAPSEPAPPRGLALVLASRSPQRREILERLGVPFEVRPSDAPELDSGEPRALALENALRKARAARLPGRAEAVIGCDTIVALAGTVYGKPADAEQARATLSALSGATHEVISGLALLLADEERTALACTAVSFRALEPRELDAYVATEEWRERSGGYAIQRAGAGLVEAVEGDIDNVVGLPLASLLALYPELCR
ncbi:MAG TPA: Maf family protein [Solirubrobacteraceae bacterium]|jgi:septum formation protein|nr:Maf family protein [Solirubrobacteraceae bacterium]